ncbi:MAG: glycosyltransferase [Chitinophagales bacterium]
MAKYGQSILKLIILSYIFIVSTALFLLCRILIGFVFFTYKNKENDTAPPVSWVICAKNEIACLEKNTAKWLEQKYHQWELIIVLDRCTDGSAEFLTKFSDHPNLKIAENLSSDLPGKRNALIAGAKAATYENILLCDADCLPESDQWIKKMAAQFDDKTDFVIGLSPYEKESGPLNAFIRFETFHTAMLYGAAAIFGKPYMAVGRNLGIKKKYLSEVYFKTAKSISGDDDLLVNQLANKNNSSICLEKGSLVYSKAKNNWKSFFRQKQRHAGAGRFYTFLSRTLLALYYLICIMFYASAVLVILLYELNNQLFYIFGAAILLNAILLFYINHKLKFGISPQVLLAGDFCLSFFLISLGILSGKQVRRW